MATNFQKKDAKNRLKIVVRGLPAQLSEPAFQSSIEKYQNCVDFFYYSPGRVTEKKNVNSRAYLNFRTPEDLQDFARSFDGHLFLTNKGKEQRAKVEYAPFQKVPSKSKKRGLDARESTIFQDPDYQKFLESLNEPVKQLPSAEEQLDKRLAEQKEAEANGQGFLTTPLLEYLKQRRAQKLKRGDRAERRKRAKERKDITGIVVNPNKKMVEEKKIQRKEKGPVTSSTRKNRDDKRKKREKGDEGEKRPESPSGNKSKKDIAEDEAKRTKNGLWQIKKAHEPGLIAIQPRDPVVQSEVGASSETAPSNFQQRFQRPSSKGPPGVHPNNTSGGPRKGPSRRGGLGRGEMKIYTPKQSQSTPVAAQNGP